MPRVALLGAVLLAAGCGPRGHHAEPTPRPKASAPAVASAAAPARRVVISVVGTNDVHGRLARLAGFGGQLANLRRARERDGGVVLVDAGDLLQGTLEGNLDEGATLMRAYGALRYDALALGNHELDFGPGRDHFSGDYDPQGALKARLAEAVFPVLCANLVRADGSPLAWRNLQARTRVRVAGVDVGIVGALTEETPAIVMPAFFKGLAVTSLAQALAREAYLARAEGAELVVAVTHAGGRCARFDDPHDASSCVQDGEIFRAAREQASGVIDVYVAGHTHAGAAHWIGDAPVVEAYTRAEAFSRVDVTFDTATRRVLDRRVFPPEPVCAPGARCEYEGAPVTPDAAVAAIARPALERARTKQAESLGVVLDVALAAEHDRETLLGDLIADRLRTGARSDVAILNGGGFRAPLPAGELRYGALYELLPFDNHLALLELRGAELREIVARHLASDRHGLIAVSGLEVRARCERGVLRVLLRGAGGREVRDRDVLRVATSDYLATGGDELIEGPARERATLDPERLVRDVVADDLRAHQGPLRATEPRIFDPARPRIAPAQRPLRCAP